jgi:basic membrane protein A
MRTGWRGLSAALLATVVVAAACGDDDDDEAAEPTAAETTPAETTGAATTAAETTAAEAVETTTADLAPQTVGYMVAGDSQDGGFYQGQVDAARATTEELGWEIIVVDQVNPGGAEEAFRNLALQGPDIIVGGGAELADGLIPTACSGEFTDITWFLVAPFPPEEPCFATGDSNEAEAHYVGGVVAGLLLDRSGETVACDIAGPELDFVQNAAASLEAGLEAHNPDYELRVTYTGDFEDAGLAQEAAQAQIDQGCQVIYPYLGGALGAVVDAGNEAGIDVVATSVDRCDDPSAEFAMAITYNPATWIDQVLIAIGEGELANGDTLGLFGVDDDAGVGARLCDASPEEQSVIDETIERISAGEVDFDAILGGAGG